MPQNNKGVTGMEIMPTNFSFTRKMVPKSSRIADPSAYSLSVVYKLFNMLTA